MFWKIRPSCGFVLLLTLCFSFFVVPTSAQIGNAGLGGTVTDQSGAAVVGAAVTLADKASGSETSFTSDDRRVHLSQLDTRHIRFDG
jgi:hypothetical protein